MQTATKSRMLRVTTLFCGLMMLFSFLTPLTLSAETAAEKYKRLKEELQSINGQIEGSEDDIAAAEQQKKALQEQKAVIDQLIVINQENIATSEADLAAKEQEISEKRATIYKNDQLFQSRLDAIYRMNNSSALSSLLSVDSFSELLVVADALQRISRHDTDLLQLLATQRKQLEEEQAVIDQLLEELKTTYAELDANVSLLATNIQATNAEISAEEANLAALAASAEETNAQLEQAQREMAAISQNMGGSRSGDGSQYVGGVFIWPVDGFYNISCQFGSPDPNGRGHRGMDISGSGISGQPIKACGAGTVLIASYAHSSYGNYVVIDHGNGVKTTYAHCSGLNVSAGGYVNAGDIIGTVGSTGFSTGAHLHLEVEDGGLQNPLNYLRG